MEVVVRGDGYGGVRVVTDSCSGLSPEAAGLLGVEVVPLTVSFGDESFLDGVEISTAEFSWRRFRAWPGRGLRASW